MQLCKTYIENIEQIDPHRTHKYKKMSGTGGRIVGRIQCRTNKMSTFAPVAQVIALLILNHLLT